VRAAAAALMLLVAAQTQVTTLIGVLGVAVWLALEILGPRFVAAPSRAKLAWAAAAVAALAAALVLLAWTGTLALALQKFRAAPQFQQDTANQFWFYHLWLVLYYPALWTTFPVLLLLALVAYPRTARLCATVFIVAFVLHSIGGRKDTRYIAYAFPFLFAVFGMGLAAAWPGLRRLLGDALRRAIPAPASGLARPRLEVAALGSILAFVVLANGAVPRLATMLAGIRVPPQPPLADWRAAAGELAPWLGSADVVVTTNELAALYHLGRYDVVLSPSRLSEVARDGREFARDARTGRPVIGSSEGLRSVLDCFGSGLLVSDRTRLEALSRQGGIGEVLSPGDTPRCPAPGLVGRGPRLGGPGAEPEPRLVPGPHRPPLAAPGDETGGTEPAPPAQATPSAPNCPTQLSSARSMSNNSSPSCSAARWRRTRRSTPAGSKMLQAASASLRGSAVTAATKEGFSRSRRRKFGQDPCVHIRAAAALALSPRYSAVSRPKLQRLARRGSTRSERPVFASGMSASPGPSPAETAGR
jgi:hypothetical protein